MDNVAFFVDVLFDRNIFGVYEHVHTINTVEDHRKPTKNAHQTGHDMDRANDLSGIYGRPYRVTACGY